MSWSYSAEVPSGAIMKRRVHYDLQQISYQDKSIPLGAIETVKMKITRQSVNGIPTATTYQFELGSSQWRGLSMNWGYASMQSKATKAQCEEAYQTLINLLDGEVRERVVAAQLSRPLPTKFGPFEITPQYVAGRAIIKTVQVAWQSVVGTDLDSGVYSLVYVNEKGAQAKMGAMDLWQDNALWLPHVVACYRNWFAGPRV